MAEGIETAEAAAVLTCLGCEEAQGFWFARPMQPAPFVQWITDRQPQGQLSSRAA